MKATRALGKLTKLALIKDKNFIIFCRVYGDMIVEEYVSSTVSLDVEDFDRVIEDRVFVLDMNFKPSLVLSIATDSKETFNDTEMVAMIKVLLKETKCHFSGRKKVCK